MAEKETLEAASAPVAEADIWHDDDGVWRQVGAQVFGPFATEKEADRVDPTSVSGGAS